MKDVSELTLSTSDVGSLPLIDDFTGVRENFRRAVLDKVSAGLDYPCYPQLVGTKENPMNMNLQMLTPLAEAGCGLSVEGDSVHLVGELSKPDRAVGVDRARYYLQLMEEEGLRERVKGLKACLTGPFTLAGYIDREDLLKSGVASPAVVSKLAEVVADSCIELDRLGFDIINVDEPFFAVIMGVSTKIFERMFGYNLDFVIDTLNKILRHVNAFSAVHVCGRLSPMTKKVLMNCDADILDHEFKGYPQNFEVYSRIELESYDKMLALGCVSSSDSRAESPEEVKKLVEKGLEAFGDRLIVKPDCGLGGLLGTPSAYEISIRKLRNMVRAVEQLRAERER